MICFEHLTVASAVPEQTRADYADLLGVAADEAGEAALQLDNLELRIRGAESGSPPGIAAVGLIGHVGEQVGRWSLGSATASVAMARREVPFTQDDATEAADPVTAAGLEHPAAIHAVDHIVIRSRDVDATRGLFEQGFGLRVLFDREFPDWKVRLCMCRVGDAVLEIAGSLDGPGKGTPEGDEEREVVAPPRDTLWGVTWRVREIEAAHERLEASGFDVSDVRTGRRPGTRVFTVRNRTGDVPTLIIQPAD